MGVRKRRNPRAPISSGPRVAACVVHYGDPALAWRAVASLAADPADLALLSRVFVVDNDPARRLGPPPASLSPALRERVEVIVSPANSGYAGGNNLALARCDPEREPLFFVLNNDARIAPGCLATLASAAEGSPRRQPHRELLFAPIILDAATLDGRLEDIRLWAAGGATELRKARAFNLFHGRRLSEIETLSAEPDCDIEAWGMRELWRRIAGTSQLFVSGCAFLGRTGPLREEGGFDEAFFLYYEDVDLCLRLASAHGRHPCRIVRVAAVWHEGSAGLKGSPLQQYYNWRNRGWTVRRHTQGRTLASALLYLAGASAAKAVLGLFREGDWRRALAILRGASRGLLGRVPPPPENMEMEN